MPFGDTAGCQPALQKRSNVSFRPLNADGDAAARRLYPVFDPHLIFPGE